MRTTICLLVSALMAVMLNSCKMSSVTMSVMEPAQITVPSHIKHLIVVNRSLPDDDSKINNVVEGIITGEGLFVDRQASENCVSGVISHIVTTDRFTAVFPTELDYRGTGTGAWPDPFHWSTVQRLCAKYKADALLALEVFDSNSGQKMSARDVTRTIDGRRVTVKEFVATMDIGIKAGWRIYDPKNKVIIDQNIYWDHMTFDGVGKSEDEADANLPRKRFAVRDAGTFAGQQYGMRISPSWIRVARSYYKKGNDAFKDAKYKVRANAWEEAAKIWQKYVNDPDPKIAGYATYNMALACEVQGDLEGALQWAKKSYKDHYNKKARSYIYILERRIANERKLKEQMGE